MFSYRPPKSSIWGHALLPRKTDIAERNLHAFLSEWFEPIVREQGSLDSYFTCLLKWKPAVLPNLDWPEVFTRPENERWQGSLCMVNIGNGSRISFGGGLMIPISETDPASYDFLQKFSAAAPFRMSANNFSVALVGKNGKVR